MANQSNDFNTPPEILDIVHKFWDHIDLDPCSNTNSLVNAIEEWNLPLNGLLLPWKGDVFVNPPFAPYYLSPDGETCLSPKEYKDSGLIGFTRYTIKDWIWKGIAHHNKGECETIFLVPARGMGSSLWQDAILPCFDSICFLKERYPFWENGGQCKGPDGKVNPPTFDCALVYFGCSPKEFRSKVSPFGHCLIGERHVGAR
jgi:hypothetical protein